MTEPDINKIAEHYAAILQELARYPLREGMRETPRVARRQKAEWK